jgi:hypothetical protein
MPLPVLAVLVFSCVVASLYGPPPGTGLVLRTPLLSQRMMKFLPISIQTRVRRGKMRAPDWDKSWLC